MPLAQECITYWWGSVSADLRGGDVPPAGDVSPNHWAIVQVTMTRNSTAAYLWKL